MYTIRRRPEARLSDNSVMQDAKMEMHDLCASVLHVGASRMRLYHVVDHNIMLLVFFASTRYRVVKILHSCSEMVLRTMKNYKVHYSLSWFRPLL
jgi:hypothetical protein